MIEKNKETIKAMEKAFRILIRRNSIKAEFVNIQDEHIQKQR